MKRVLSVLLSVLVLVTAFAVPASAGAPTTRHVVVFQNGGIPTDAAVKVAAAGGQLVKTFPQVGLGIAVSSDPNFAISLKGLKDISDAGPERFLKMPAGVLDGKVKAAPVSPAPALWAYQWDIRRVKADQAWTVTRGTHKTVVAVIDTGIAWNHPDLAANVVFHTCFSSQSSCLDYPAFSTHGTHVAGTIAAAGYGVAGVGPGLGLASYNVFEVNGTELMAADESVWAAMLDAADRGYEVINMSFGELIDTSDDTTGATRQAWSRVVRYALQHGTTLVASAGNDGVNLNGSLMHIPSDLFGVISVGATGIRPQPAYPQPGASDVLAYYSNYGDPIALVAPGGDLGPDGTAFPEPAVYYTILSTVVAANPICAATASCPVDYSFDYGTSTAAPHVAGVAGLIKTVRPRIDPLGINLILRVTAKDVGNRLYFGAGMVDALAAVSK